MKNLIVIFIALMTTNQSCSNKKITQSETKTNTVKENKTLDSDRWFLTKFGPEKVNDKNAFIEFDIDELKFSGKSFCNSIFGRLLIEGESKIEFTNLGMTMMACQDMSQEEIFNKMLRSVKSYKVVKNQLILSNGENREILFFSTEEPEDVQKENEGVYTNEKSPLVRLYDIWGLKEMNSKTISGEKNMMIEINTKEMTFMGYGSCNKIFGSIAGGKENEVSFLNVGATRKLCPDFMEYETEFIKSLKLVKTYQLKSLHLLLFDENGNLVLDFVKMD